jgi:NADH-quinone oxidoreductase subunit E
MSPISAFILGLLAGLLIEWIIDWLYWRRRVKELQAEISQAKAGKAAAGYANQNLESQSAAMADFTSLQQENDRLEADKSRLNLELLALQTEKSSLTQELEACRGRLSASESRQVVEAPAIPAEPAAPVVLSKEPPTVQLTKAAPAVPVVPDDLVIIKGIGPVINRKLNQGGIYTFEQLAALTPARLREIVGDVIQRLADEDEIINQAKELAARKAGGG